MLQILSLSRSIGSNLVVALLVATSLMIAPNARASAPDGAAKKTIHIITTTPTFADIANRVGGEFVDAKSLMKGRENVHTVPPKPSFIMKLRRADFFIHAGLDGEPWVPQLLNTSRRPNLRVGAPGNIDASIGIQLLEVPDRASLSRANGDVHVFGNPHYMTDPLNGVIVAKHIRDVLIDYDPDHADAYRTNCDAFESDIKDLIERMDTKLEPYRGAKVIVYHKAWPYFLNRFHLVEAGAIEPKPDIPPGPKHLLELEQLIKNQHVRVIIVDTFNPLKVGQRVADKTGAVAIVLAANVHGIEGADDYISLFETDIDRLVKAFESSTIQQRAPKEQAE